MTACTRFINGGVSRLQWPSDGRCPPRSEELCHPRLAFPCRRPVPYLFTLLDLGLHPLPVVQVVSKYSNFDEARPWQRASIAVMPDHVLNHVPRQSRKPPRWAWANERQSVPERPTGGPMQHCATETAPNTTRHRNKLPSVSAKLTNKFYDLPQA